MLPLVFFSELTEPPVVPVTPLDVVLVPVVEFEVPEVELPAVPVALETILNAPSIETLAVFGSSSCWWTSIFWTSRPVPEIMTFAVAPTAGSKLKVCENGLPDEARVDVPATPPVVLVPPLDVVPPRPDEVEPPVVRPVALFAVLFSVALLPVLLVPGVVLLNCVGLLEVLLPVTALCKDLPAFCNEF